MKLTTGSRFNGILKPSTDPRDPAKSILGPKGKVKGSTFMNAFGNATISRKKPTKTMVAGKYTVRFAGRRIFHSSKSS